MSPLRLTTRLRNLKSSKKSRKARSFGGLRAEWEAGVECRLPLGAAASRFVEADDFADGLGKLRHQVTQAAHRCSRDCFGGALTPSAPAIDAATGALVRWIRTRRARRRAIAANVLPYLNNADGDHGQAVPSQTVRRLATVVVPSVAGTASS